MPISFNSVPAVYRAPFAFVEFSNERAVAGPQRKPYKVLVIGQRLTTGSKAALDISRVTSAAQARQFYGAGSMLAEMLEKFFQSNTVTEVFGLPVSDNGAGVAAVGSIKLTGAPTEAGTVVFYVAGKRVTLGVSSGADLGDLATALAAALEAIPNKPFDAVVDNVDDEKVNITYKHKGLVGNALDIRQGYFDDEKGLPAGLGATIVQFTGGTANPDLTAAIAAFPDDQFDFIVAPYTDSNNVALIDAELEDRWGPAEQADGTYVTAAKGTQGGLGTIGDSFNSKHVVIQGVEDSPDGVHLWAADLGAVLAFNLNIDPARPVQTLALTSRPAEKKNALTRDERNLLLFDGISTYYRDDNGVARVERTITTYKTNELGADDPSYLDIEPIKTLSAIRYDWRNYLLRKYPRHKLANDGTLIAPGQATVTPKIVKAEAIAKFREWEEIGWVEGFAQFKNDLIVERNVSDRNRLDILMSPDLINALRITATKIAFIL